jgi:hypothetical protein
MKDNLMPLLLFSLQPLDEEGRLHERLPLVIVRDDQERAIWNARSLEILDHFLCTLLSTGGNIVNRNNESLCDFDYLHLGKISVD